MLAVEVQNVVDDKGVPSARELARWAKTAFRGVPGAPGSAEMTIRIVGEAEARELNSRYRHADRATNVLSFPFEDPPGVETGILGDVVICAPVVAREAMDQNKGVREHWAHMVVHGVLHLLGHDHDNDSDAEIMEALEDDIMRALGFPGPYLADHG
jgi:probable rRNA maturation factor